MRTCKSSKHLNKTSCRWCDRKKKKKEIVDWLTFLKKIKGDEIDTGWMKNKKKCSFGKHVYQDNKIYITKWYQET